MPQSDADSIRDTLARYCQFMDDARYDDVARLFTDDGRWTILGVEHRGSDAIRAVMAAWPGPTGTKHITTNSIIEVSGESAEAVSDYVLVQPSEIGGIAVRGGRYHDTLRREHAGRWLFVARENRGTSFFTV